jgi:hypothetical protein
MRLTFLLCSILALCASLGAQRHDNTWVLGYSGFGVEYGHSILTFDNGSLIIDTIPTNMWDYEFPHNNSAYSNFEGSLFAFFNGIQVQNSLFKAMENGENLNEEIVKYNYYMSDPFIPKGSTLIPYPDKPDSLILLYTSLLYLINNGLVEDACSGDISGAVISISANNGLGRMLERQQRIIENDTLIRGELAVCKHANGRDWWLLAFKRNSNKYHRVLIDPKGFHNLGISEVELPVWNGAGTACFSPDGSRFSVFNSISQTSGSYLDVFHFDRCSGMLSDQIQIHDVRGYGGLAFSPNSRYLYHNKHTVAHQYDLWAANIPASRQVVAVYDGFKDPFSTTFYMLQLAPDGKIYGSATNGTRTCTSSTTPTWRAPTANTSSTASDCSSTTISACPTSPTTASARSTARPATRSALTTSPSLVPLRTGHAGCARRGVPRPVVLRAGHLGLGLWRRLAHEQHTPSATPVRAAGRLSGMPHREQPVWHGHALQNALPRRDGTGQSRAAGAGAGMAQPLPRALRRGAPPPCCGARGGPCGCTTQRGGSCWSSAGIWA